MAGEGMMTLVYIGLWYALNIGYNIYNKDLCNGFPLAYTVGTTSLGAGLIYVLPNWYLGIRPVPKMDSEDVKNIGIISVLHCVGHFGAVISMSMGAVSFTHIVKAAEPVFSTVLAGLILNKWAAWQVNLSLVPVILGVVIASVKINFDTYAIELGDFNMGAFVAANISNLAFALRSMYMKKMDDSPEKKAACKSKNLDSANIYAVYTIFAFILAIPLALYMEGAEVVALSGSMGSASYNSATISGALGANAYKLMEMHLITGLFFYLYNEASSLALGNLDSVQHAVCNTVKRVVIMVAMSFFDTPLTLQKWTGAGIAIGGTLVYTLVKNSVEAAAKKKKA
mmetsp:Transcript_32753/g.73932  ORF Transcript_32753/g.73932 Transcript_32753/m.73932 type:complete len:340 (-) Transcript_32753:213-1232(-)